MYLIIIKLEPKKQIFKNWLNNIQNFSKRTDFSMSKFILLMNLNEKHNYKTLRLNRGQKL